MEATAVFADPMNPPEDAEVSAVLGRAAGRWTDLLAHLAETFPPTTATWKYYKASGWILRVMRKKRTIFWVVPRPKHFRTSTAFGEKAVAAAKESDLPAAVIEKILSARKFAEGRPVRTDVRTRARLETAMKIAAIKMAH